MNSILRFLWLLACLVSVLSLASEELPPEIERQYHALRDILEKADVAYFHAHESLMSDAAYDALRDYLEQLRSDHPSLAQLGSTEPTRKDRDRVQHPRPMLSLNKVYSDDALLQFCEQTRALTNRWVIEPKIDGASIRITYQNGRLVSAATRGDTQSGVDVTAVVFASGALPLKLTGAPPRLELRGEAFLRTHDFLELNQTRTSEGNPPYRSARNLAAATLMLKNPNEVVRRQLQICIFECRNAQELGYTSHLKSLAFLASLGLPTIDSFPVERPQAVVDRVNELEPQRAGMSFETDGWVIKVDAIEAYSQLGSTQKFPRWAVARKFRPKPTMTTVIDIERSVSERGRITPVAILEPVQIDGATIQRATLHSEPFLEAMGIQIGSKVWIIRAGGAVPEILGLVEEAPP